MSSTPPVSDDVQLFVEAFWNMEEKIMSKNGMTASDAIFTKEVHVSHVAWKFNDLVNELWIDGVLGVVFTPKVKNPEGCECTKVHYSFNNPQNNSIHKELFYEMDHLTLAKYHILWLTEPKVLIESATIDMEFDQCLMEKDRNFRVKRLSISVITNFNSINGWLQNMDPHYPMEHFHFRGNGILDANKLLLHPYISGLKKLMIIYESSFDDRTLNMLNATEIQLSSDFITEAGINRLLQRWNNEDYPIRASIIIYMRINRPEGVLSNLELLDTVEHPENGVTEYLIQMSKNKAKRMRIVMRTSSIICTVFAVDNSLAESIAEE